MRGEDRARLAREENAVKGTRENPLTWHDITWHDHRTARRGQWCKCADCNVVAQSTSSFDFYDFDGVNGLFCPTCQPRRLAQVLARLRAEKN